MIKDNVEVKDVAKVEQWLSKMLDAGVDDDQGECRGERRGLGVLQGCTAKRNTQGSSISLFYHHFTGGSAAHFSNFR